MACLFLIMLLFLNTVKAIECHENWPRSVEIKKEKCFMEETHQRNGENAVDDREDSLHRIRREDSIQNLFHKTPWHSLEQDGNNVKQKHLIFRDKGGERWKSFIRNKIRKKRIPLASISFFPLQKVQKLMRFIFVGIGGRGFARFPTNAFPFSRAGDKEISLAMSASIV
uniref:Uncharacterized protein n=1 Tax=Cacopsylla melanoneura TaxID=428564 RepID=A0A8D9BMD9_9HEMI